MILNARNDTFTFFFPIKFVPDWVNERYAPYLNKMPGNLITKPIDLINYGVQSLNLPGAAFTPVEQVGKHGRIRTYRDAKPEQELLSKELTVTIQMLDGYINYWMMLDIFSHWYGFEESSTHLPEGTAIRIHDSEGLTIVTIQMKRMLFTEIGAIDMSFSNNELTFSTFDCTFSYNELYTNVDLD